MLSERLRLYRHTKGLSLEGLVKKMNYLVTKQALSQYEFEKHTPSPIILDNLALVLGVKKYEFFLPINIKTKYLDYKKPPNIRQRELERLKNFTIIELEKKIDLKDNTLIKKASKIPIKKFDILNLKETDKAALNLRKLWKMGAQSDLSLKEILQDHQIYTLQVDTKQKFDGVSLYAENLKGDLLGIAILINSKIDSKNQNIVLLHELGHIVLNIFDNVDEELAIYRFGSAFYYYLK